MFGLQNEDAFAKNEKKLRELLEHSKRQESHLEKLLHDHQILGEDLMAFLSNPEHFDSSTWKKMEQMRKDIQQKTQTDLKQIKDPLSTKKKYNDIKDSQNWIPVR